MIVMIEMSIGCPIRKKRSFPSNFFNLPESVPLRDEKYIVTLVWDIDETLLNVEWEKNHSPVVVDAEPLIRPNMNDCLLELNRPDVEFLIWTAGTVEHAYRTIESFPDVRFDYVISRKTGHEPKPKDLTRLRRGMNTIIIIDDNPKAGSMNPHNVLLITPFQPIICREDMTSFNILKLLGGGVERYRRVGGDLRFLLHGPETYDLWYDGCVYRKLKDCFLEK